MLTWMIQVCIFLPGVRRTRLQRTDQRDPCSLQWTPSWHWPSVQLSCAANPRPCRSAQRTWLSDGQKRHCPAVEDSWSRDTAIMSCLSIVYYRSMAEYLLNASTYVNCWKFICWSFQVSLGAVLTGTRRDHVSGVDSVSLYLQLTLKEGLR